MMKDNADLKASGKCAGCRLHTIHVGRCRGAQLLPKAPNCSPAQHFDHAQTILLLTWHTHGSYRKSVTGGCKSMKRHARYAMEIIMKTSARINAQFVEAATLKMCAMKTFAASAAKNTQGSIARQQPIASQQHQCTLCFVCKGKGHTNGECILDTNPNPSTDITIDSLV